MGLIPEQIENKDKARAKHVVVKAQKQGQYRKSKEQKDPCRSSRPGLFLCQLFEAGKSHKGKEKGEHDVLVGKLQDFPGHHQVKGDFTDQGKEAHPHQILSAVPGMGKTLRQAEGKNGHGYAAYDPHPGLAGKKVVSHMVEDHADHSQKLEGRPVQKPVRSDFAFCFLHKIIPFLFRS